MVRSISETPIITISAATHQSVPRHPPKPPINVPVGALSAVAPASPPVTTGRARPLFSCATSEAAAPSAVGANIAAPSPAMARLIRTALRLVATALSVADNKDSERRN
jgi:hypothetical protein